MLDGWGHSRRTISTNMAIPCLNREFSEKALTIWLFRDTAATAATCSARIGVNRDLMKALLRVLLVLVVVDLRWGSVTGLDTDVALARRAPAAIVEMTRELDRICSKIIASWIVICSGGISDGFLTIKERRCGHADSIELLLFRVKTARLVGETISFRNLCS